VKLQLKKRRLIPVALAILVLVVGSGVAYAFWTAGGTGGGSANAAASVSNVTVHQTTVLTDMYPGDTEQTITGNFANPNAAAVFVHSVTASIASVSGTCAKDNFLIGGTADGTQTVLVDAAVNHTDSLPTQLYTGSWTGIHIQFNNKPLVNQDECKSATVTLTFTASGV
jgi:hypothetical protein